MARGTTDWDAKAYDRLAAPQEEWAREVLARLPLRGDETALDAGCGSGPTPTCAALRVPLALRYVRLSIEARVPAR